MKNLLLSLTITISAFTISACTSEKLDPLAPFVINNVDYISVNADFCLLQPTETKVIDNTVIIIDKSTSNEDTDPSGIRRYFPLRNYYINTPENLGFSYTAFINFSDSAQILNPQQPFTDVKNNIINTINTEWNMGGTMIPIDYGFTDYLAALTQAYTLIKDDVIRKKNLNTSEFIRNKYNLVLVTDGAPIVPDPTNPNGFITQSWSAIQSKIDQIMGLISDPLYADWIQDIQINTGYYFNTLDATAENLLSQIAAYSNGKFFKFAAGNGIDFRQFKSAVQNIKHALKEIWVSNNTGMWWENGGFLRDSDGDGLPDELELSNGSSPNVADSDGNGVRDGIEYQLYGKPCKSSTCSHSITERLNIASCDALMPPTTPDGQSNPTPDGVNPAGFGTNYHFDTDGDGLNGCEEYLLRSDRTKISSNYSMILDFHGFLNQLPIVPGQNQSMLDYDNDLVNNYLELKLGSSTQLDNRMALHTKDRVITTTKQDSTNGDECYNLKVDNVRTVGRDNQIQVSVIEDAVNGKAKYMLRKAVKTQSGFSTGTINFNNNDFH